MRSHLPIPAALFLPILIIVAACCGLCYYHRIKTGFTTALTVWVFLLGVAGKTYQEAQKDRLLAAAGNLHYTSYLARVVTLPEKRANSIRFEVNATHFHHGGQWTAKPFRALVYLRDSLSGSPTPGNLLVIRGKLKPPSPPQNPEQFDYAHYLRNKGILLTGSVNAGSYRLISGNENDSPIYWPERASQWADAVFRTQIGDSAAYGLVKAMLLGRRDDLRQQQVGDYTISGAVHILSVSGMHIAIIFLVMSAALGWLRRCEVGKWIYLCLMAALLGFYALVTGLPPSVQRAGLMCAVLLLAELAGRKHHSMNTLAFSALVILLMDPCALYDVGFQLSYLAMAGIFLLYEPIYGIVVPSNRVCKFLWQVTALALAAQIGTFPLSLFYFHQFPTYFWLVNPLIVTFTNVLLPAALLLLLAGAFGPSLFTFLVAKVVYLSAWLTDWAAAIPRAMPGHLLENLHLSAWEMILLYAIMFLAWYTIHSRSFRALKVVMGMTVLFVSSSMAGSMHTYLKSEHIAFEMPRHSVVGFKSGNVLFVVSDRSFRDDDRAFDFNLKNYAVSREIQRIVHVTAP